jgi:hypothetical protein
VVVLSGTGSSIASSVIAMATTASEKNISRSVAPRAMSPGSPAAPSTAPVTLPSSGPA